MVISEETDNHTGLSLPQRKPPRLKYFDYSSPGAYFITICANERKCLFGSILNDKMYPNEAGVMIQEWWQKLPVKFGIELDYYVIMPNHFHGIIMIPPVGTTPCGCPTPEKPVAVGTTPCGCPTPDIPRQPRENGELLFQIIGWFKTMTTNECIRGVKQKGWPRFEKHVWQPRYHDHVVRNRDKLNMIRNYIQTNPMRWTMDCFHPDSISKW